ncbi:MAG: ABC transporter permease [Chloroflexota bacterium]|nr:MAG: ABC transporter permease [Chloroflexota bacterium]
MAEANQTIDTRVAPTSATLEQLSTGLSRQPRTLWGDAWRRFRRHKLAMIGVAILTFFALTVTVGAPLYVQYRVSQAEATGIPILPRDRTLPKVMNALDFMAINSPPSAAHPFGTDELGRDLLARAIYGGRISLAVGFVAMLIAVSLGAIIGSVSGFFGGTIDQLLMRLTDLFLSLPGIPLILLTVYLFREPVTRALGPETGIFVIVVTVIGGLAWMSTARIVRATFLSLKQKEFVEAATALGISRWAIMFKHILPNAFSPIIVAATLEVGSAIITESTLSFLGVGFPPDTPTWGRLVTDGSQFLQVAPWLALFPGALIFLTVLSINFLGDGLRDALDPRSRL